MAAGRRRAPAVSRRSASATGTVIRDTPPMEPRSGSAGSAHRWSGGCRWIRSRSTSATAPALRWAMTCSCGDRTSRRLSLPNGRGRPPTSSSRASRRASAATTKAETEGRMSIRTTTLEGVTTIEIARPEKKNALTQSMYQRMAEAIAAATDDDAVRALLITGQPGIFTSGNDLEDFLNAPALHADSPLGRFMQALPACSKPVVAAVTGPAIGIGATLLLHCDLVYMSDQARLVFPFVSLGVVPEFGSSLLLPQLMGHARAAEQLLLGEPLSAE